MALRWGIASAGKISNDFVTSLTILPQENHQVVAVAAADLGRCEAFAKTHKIPKFYQGYEGLAKDPNVEIVYVGSINPQHFSIAMLMLDHGKHVICEKPLCINEKQVKKLISFAQSKNLFLMEAIWSRFFPVYKYLEQLINSGTLGDIKEVDVSFGFEIKEIDRIKKKELGGGTVLDLGVYTIQLSQFIFKDSPLSVEAKGILNDEGIDLEVETKLTYPGNRISRMKTSALNTLNNTANIKGTKGEVTILNFWCPISMIDVDGTERKFELPQNDGNYNFMNSAGLHFEAEAARLQIRNGCTECPTVSHAESLIIARIEDEIRKQIGVNFPEDNQEF